jgi:hypothetical protein
MKKKGIIISIVAIVLVLVSITTMLLTKGSWQKPMPRKDFTSYIAAHTYGTVSTRSTIQVVFASDVVGSELIGKTPDSKLFRIKPSVKGSLSWVNARTLEFNPSSPLPSDKQFQVSLALKSLFNKIPKDFEGFNFSFRTIKQAMEVRVAGITFYDDPIRTDRRVAGKILTPDFAENEKIVETLKATQQGKELKITWESTYDGRSHQFWIEGVSQTEEEGKVELKFSGKPINADFSETIDVEIPPLGVFRVLGHEVVQTPEQYLEIRFSEPIDPLQNLNGLIRSETVRNIRLVAEGNVVKVFPSSRLSGQYNFEITEGIRSAQRKSLGESTTITVTFEYLKPQVRLLSEGVILPSSGGLIFPFQAVSLKAVDVKVIRIFENNIGQFLQVNDLKGQNQLKRVGRMILRKTVLLNQTGQADFSTWNTYNLDLTNLIQAEPGAIYQITISFRRAYSTYKCDGESAELPLEMIDEHYDHSDDNAYGYYYWDDDYDDYYEYYSYSWNERENPCKDSYYRDVKVQRNVLASDLGIIAKAGTEGSMLFAVTDLNTAQPMGGVLIEVMNYQQQIIATATTDNSGQANISLTGQDKPFLLVARSGKSRGYLKLDQGSCLSLSAFDVSGVAVQKGLKGYIYGERGVWRPGDTLFLTFILEDKLKTLPANHPVNFDLSDPRGQVVYRTVATASVSGMYSFPVVTESGAVTGTYTARVKIGGVTYTEPVRVETVMPNRLKINIKIDGDALYYGKTNSARLSSNWLHGAPARNLKAKVDAILSQSTTSFKDYPKFSFDDPARSFYADEYSVFEGVLSENGSVNFVPDISVRSSAPGVLKASFTVRVFEQGGAFSIDRFTMPYYPYRNFVGVKLPHSGNKRNTYYTDTTYKVEVVSIDSDGKPVPRQSLNVEVYKIDWRWWWERGNEDLSNYISSSYHRPILRGNITTDSNGEGFYNLRINRPLWGRFLVRVVDPNGGHATGTIAYFDWPGWVKRDRSAMPEGATMLVFASDKEGYNVGETANITIPSADGGKIYLTIENGVKVLQSHWIDAKAGETQFSIPITSDMAPNVFVNAMLIQPHGQTVNDLPIRLYGIVGISVEDPKTKLEPVISMIDELKPEEQVSITISEKNGRPMAFTLAIVDDGLLDLTRFRTPNPWQSFYAREALGVKTWDLFDLVLGASAGRMQRIITIGGDEEIVGKDDKTANRFKPMVRYFGPYELGKDKKEKITFKMPNYIGSVRVMAIAAKEGAYGSTEKTVPVKKPLMVLATLPRVLGPEEDVVLPVAVFAMDKKVKQVKVRVETNNMLSVKGTSEQVITFDEIGDQVIRFNLKVASMLGVGTVKVHAESDGEKASHEIELNVRNPNPPMTLVKDTILKEGEIWGASYKAFGMVGTNSALVEFSTLPPINLGSRLNYLLGYPHGCLEQTVSKAFPQLLISKLADVDEEARKYSEENVRFALDRIKNYRSAEGGLSLWPGAYYPDEWASTYAGHFMLEAQKLGYTLPYGILDGWKSVQRKLAQNWSYKSKQNFWNSDLMQAYRLYTLALAKSPEMGAMNRLRESPSLSVQAKWRLAAAYAIAGNPEAAKQLIQGIPTSIDSYREQGYTYGSDLRDRAMIVETLVLLGNFEMAMPLLRELSQRLSSKEWMSTQEISYSLLAFSKFASLSPASEGVDASVGIHGKASKRFTSKLSLLQHKFEPVQSGSEKVEVKNNGKGLLYSRLITSGIPVGGNEVAQNNNLQMEVDYCLMDGTKTSPENLSQGTDFYVDIKVYNPGIRGNLEQLILSVIVPSGWEIRTSRLDEGQASLKSSSYEYQDIRDDRVYTYFSLPNGNSKNFRIRFNATYEGKFYMPGIACEAMYDNSINARKVGNWVEVKK